MPNSLIDLLESLDFGSSVAEDETKNLVNYFVDTRFWRNLRDDKYDIILGAKGTGKSALYLNLINKKDDFSQRGIIIVEAENPRGDTVFALLNSATRTEKYENPNKEALIQDDIIDFWKLYFLTVITAKLRSQEFRGKHFQIIESLFESAGLLPKAFSLNGAFNNVLHFLRQVVSLQFFQPEMEVDPATGTFTVKGKISFEKYAAKDHSEGYSTLDELFEKLNADLNEANQFVWVLLDRLDVAFVDDKDLERRALKSLFMTYNALKKFDRFRCKIFLRDDIMLKVTYDGLREASHLTRMTNLVIDEKILFNILMKRLLNNPSLLRLSGGTTEEYLADIEKQKQFFYSVFPKKITETDQEFDTFEWMVGRISDGNGVFTPRELIQLVNQSKERQIELIEMGNKVADGEVISVEALKWAIRDVSTVKFDRTLLSENPNLVEIFRKFRNAKPTVTVDWMIKYFKGKESDEIDDLTNALADIGFLKRMNENEWFIPYLYQYALGIAEED